MGEATRIHNSLNNCSLNLSHQSHQREEVPSLVALLSPSRPKLWQTFLPLRKSVLPEREKEALKCRSCDESFTVQTVRVVKIAAVLILDISKADEHETFEICFIV